MSIVPIRIMPLLSIFDVTSESYLRREKEDPTEDVTPFARAPFESLETPAYILGPL